MNFKLLAVDYLMRERYREIYQGLDYNLKTWRKEDARAVRFERGLNIGQQKVQKARLQSFLDQLEEVKLLINFSRF